MRVSVIMRTYNRGYVIREAIAPALCVQTYPDFEIIVVDDGSTDGTAEVLCAGLGTNKFVTSVTIQTASQCGGEHRYQAATGDVVAT